jgi:hypothetical protein
MKRIVCASEIVASFTKEKEELEVCATEEANFDEGRSQLLVELNSFVRPVDPRSKLKVFVADWLPKKQSLRESVSQEEAAEVAREIFHRWAGKVREAVPSPFHR